MRLLQPGILLAFCVSSSSGRSWVISPVAGGGLPVNIAGTSASLGSVEGVSTDRAGNVLIANPLYHIVLRLDASSNVLTLVAGSATAGFSGDDGPASLAQLKGPCDAAPDSAGDVYVVDTENSRIRKVSNGIITTVAGNGVPGFSGDDGPAIGAQLNVPVGLALDSAGNLYIADLGNNRIRMVSNGIITTVAGNGTYGYSGDHGPATSAQLNSPEGIALDSAGNLYIADSYNNVIRMVSNRIITTVAGNGSYGFYGDGGQAVYAELAIPSGIATDTEGNLYIADSLNGRIREVSNGVISTLAGNGMFGPGGDNGPAGSSPLFPIRVAVDAASNIYVSDADYGSVRKVAKGVINTVAGGGTQVGDGASAVGAQLGYPSEIALDQKGDLYIADSANNRVRKVSNGVITTVAGNGTAGFSGDNGPAVSAQLSNPLGVAVDLAGNVYIADFGSNRVRKVSNGIITTVAGTGSQGFSGDGGPPTNARLAGPRSVAVDYAGNLYIADSSNNRVRKVSNGVILTVAGTGTAGFNGDGGPATAARLSDPWGLAVDSSGNLYLADHGNNRIRVVSNGVISSVAGDGNAGSSGDNGPPLRAGLSPAGVALDSAGVMYIADVGNNRIRMVAKGVITTIAGGGAAFGDNGLVDRAQLDSPADIVADYTGQLLVADFGNNRIRLLSFERPKSKPTGLRGWRE